MAARFRCLLLFKKKKKKKKGGLRFGTIKNIAHLREKCMYIYIFFSSFSSSFVLSHGSVRLDDFVLEFGVARDDEG